MSPGGLRGLQIRWGVRKVLSVGSTPMRSRQKLGLEREVVIMQKITVVAILLVALFTVSSCASGVSQEEYDRLNDELSVAQSQLASLQQKSADAEVLRSQNEVLRQQYDTIKSELETTQAEYEELNAANEELGKQNDTLTGQFETVKANYEELSADYEELNAKYEELSSNVTAGAAQINEADVGQAIFALVNQERKNSGLDEQIWGENIYKWGLSNSRNMAENKRIQYSDYPSWQQVFWATGYGTVDRIANAALTIWRNDQQYERSILGVGAIYGAVAVYRSGEIFYITYIASSFR
jgi:cell division protein FtsB